MKTKQTNVLLIKDDVGKSKPFTRELPPEHFSFGKKVRPDDEGVAQGKTEIMF